MVSTQSGIVSIARTHAKDGKLRCFTIGFKDRGENSEGMAEDQVYAEQVAKHLGVEIETIVAGPEMVQELERMVYHLDEPTADPAALQCVVYHTTGAQTWNQSHVVRHRCGRHIYRLSKALRVDAESRYWAGFQCGSKTLQWWPSVFQFRVRF